MVDKLLKPGYLRFDGTKFVTDPEVDITGPAGVPGAQGIPGPSGPMGPTGPAGTGSNITGSNPITVASSVVSIAAASASTAGSMSAADKITHDQITANEVSTSVAITDANATITVAQGKRRSVATSVLSADRTITLSTTGASAGDTITVNRDDYSQWKMTFVNGGAGGGNLYILGGKGNFAAQFDGTNWKKILSNRPNGDKTLNLLDFGAKGDGVTDDTTAIQNWLNAVPNSTAGRAEMPLATYVVSKMLRITNVDYTRCFEVAGVQSGRRAARGPKIQFNGFVASTNAFLTAKTTSTSIQTYSGAGLDGATGTSALSDHRRISVTLTGVSTAYIDRSVVTISGVDIWGNTTTEDITLFITNYFSIGFPSSTTATTFPVTFTGFKYWNNITQVSIAAQASTAGTISVGYAGATMVLIASSSQLKMKNIDFNCNGRADRGIHMLYNEALSVGQSNLTFEQIGVYSMRSADNGAGIAYGDQTGAQVSELEFIECSIDSGDFTSTYLTDGLLCVNGNNAGNITIISPAFTNCRIGINLLNQNSFSNVVSYPNCSGSHLWTMAFGSAVNLVEGGYSEGGTGGALLSYQVGVAGKLYVNGLVARCKASDNNIVLTNGGMVHLEHCEFQNYDNSNNYAETKICVGGANFQTFTSKYNTYFAGTDTSVPPLYNTAGTYLLFGRLAAGIFATGSFPYQVFESIGDRDFVNSVYWDHLTLFPPRATVPGLTQGAFANWGTTAAPAMCKYTIPFSVTYTYFNTIWNGFSTSTSYLYLPAGFKIVGMYARVVTAFTHSTITGITCEVGASDDGLTTNNILLPFSVMATGIFGLSNGDLGTALDPANTVQGGYLTASGYLNNHPMTIVVKRTSGSGTFGTLTAGSLRFQIIVEGPGKFTEL